MKLNTYFDKCEFVVTGEVGPIQGAIARDKAIVPNCAQETSSIVFVQPDVQMND